MNLQELKQAEEMVFNNEHQPWEEWQEAEIHFGQISTWDSPFKIFHNGQLVASFKTFKSAKNHMTLLINQFDLKRVQ